MDALDRPLDQFCRADLAGAHQLGPSCDIEVGHLLGGTNGARQIGVMAVLTWCASPSGSIRGLGSPAARTAVWNAALRWNSSNSCREEQVSAYDLMCRVVYGLTCRGLLIMPWWCPDLQSCRVGV